MKVLYLGATWRGSNAQSWRRAFEILGHEVVAIDPESVLGAYDRSLFLRAYRKLFGGPWRGHLERVRGQALRAAREFRPDWVFAARADWLDVGTLEAMRRDSGALLVHWHPDDYRNPHNLTAAFAEAIPVYDACVTPKSFNVAELHADGARRVEYLPYAYDPEVHRPPDTRPAQVRDACFVGGWEPERALVLEHLARERVDLTVWGPLWHRLPRRSPLRDRCTFRGVYAADMAEVFNASRLSLGFLRKVNRDLHTARTFEIPASGGLMLAERSDEQRAFFAEDREALYFGDAGEALEKILYYAPRADLRDKIRAAALERCARDGYRYQDRLAQLVLRLRRGA